MRFLAAAILFSLFMQPLAFAAGSSTAAAEPPPAAPDVSSVIFMRAVFSNGSAVSGMPLVLLARGSKTDTVYRTITDRSGLVILSLQNGSYELDALLDMPLTAGMDFASTTSLRVPSNGNATLIFYPAGSLAGKVLSGGAPVPRANVSVSCPSSAFDYSRINGGVAVQAGEAGDFLFRALPAGACVISASTETLAGSVETQVSPGQVSSASVEMGRKAAVAQDNSLLLSAATLAAAATIIAIAFFLAGKAKTPSAPGTAPHEKTTEAKHGASAKARKKEAQPEEESGFDANSPKARAVLATLSEREREIVRFLFKCNGKAKRSQVQHKLLIPKTSLLRNLRSLERKNIVKLTPFGRNLLAELEQSLFR